MAVAANRVVSHPEDGRRYELYNGEVFEIPSLFEQHRLREYWLVDPDEPAIEVYRLADARLELAAAARGDDRIESPLLTSLDLRPSDLVLASFPSSRRALGQACSWFIISVA